MRATITPTGRFRKDADGRVRLRHGDIRVLSGLTGKSPGHISRVIGGERESVRLSAELEDLIGAPLSHVELPRAQGAA